MKLVNQIIDRIFIIGIIMIMLLSVYSIVDSNYLRTVGMANTVYKPDKESPDEYIKVGEDCVGWIYIKNTTIDYPIMQADDNFKYLNTAPDGSYSLAGSIFLDMNCSKNFDDGYSLIHGHHMSGNKQMFSALDAYIDEAYLDTHTECELTFNSEVHNAYVFGFMILDANEDIIFDPGFTGDRYEFIKQNAMHFREPIDKSHIVTLATCRDPGTTNRTLVFLSFKR